METDLHKLAIQVGKSLSQHSIMLTTAESCTGGLLSQTITSVPDSSTWFERGFVTYSNQAKLEMLQVSSSTLEKFDAVSEETVIEMAEGALFKAGDADVSVAITGYAGPTGGTENAPLGTIWFAIAGTEKETITFRQRFIGNREEVRREAVVFILQKLIEVLEK